MKCYNNKLEAISAMNNLGADQVPFLFLIDFEMKKIIIETDTKCNNYIHFDINGFTNRPLIKPSISSYYFDKYPIPKEKYAEGFNLVANEIQLGNSFLLNLTYPTRLMTNLSLDDIYNLTSSKYKIYLKNHFVCYSPEIFVKIQDGIISSYPMKGTIDASLPNAEKTILEDKKEIAEHYTIVDLIRNDLSRVAKKVKVKKFRYIDEIRTSEKNLLQVSSEVAGELPSDYMKKIGSIIFELLPAGSISGAPKPKTLQVIRNAEGGERGYYTGICGYFDGKNLDSGVMIRYIEKVKDYLYYRSGCGVTSMSQMDTEYEEMIDKVYLPLHSKKGITLQNDNLLDVK